MPKIGTILLAAALAAPLAACGARQPTTISQPEPTYVEPVELAQEPAYKPEELETEPEFLTDAEIHQRVDTALQRVPGLREENVRVTVEPGGVVHLTGRVNTAAQKRSVHDVVHAVDGVTSVYVDDLNVR